MDASRNARCNLLVVGASLVLACAAPWVSNILAVRIFPSEYSARHRRWPALVALLVILNATVFLCHQYDLTEHAPGHTCVTCVAGHMLDHSLRSQIYFHPVIPFVTRYGDPGYANGAWRDERNDGMKVDL